MRKQREKKHSKESRNTNSNNRRIYHRSKSFINSQLSGSKLPKAQRTFTSEMDISQNKVDLMARSGSTSEMMSNFRNIQNSAAINSELNKSPEKLVAVDTKKHC